MIVKPERIIKRIIKATGQRQSVLIIGNWQEDLTKGIKENQNIITQTHELQKESQVSGLTSCFSPLTSQVLPYEDNSFTRIIADYNSLTQSSIYNPQYLLNEARRLLLPTGMVIISANSDCWIFEKVFNFFKKNQKEELDNLQKIKPKALQDLIHNNGFLIDGYYGYPGRHLLMMATIINKEVTTLFTSERQETIKT